MYVCERERKKRRQSEQHRARNLLFPSSASAPRAVLFSLPLLFRSLPIYLVPCVCLRPGVVLYFPFDCFVCFRSILFPSSASARGLISCLSFGCFVARVHSRLLRTLSSALQHTIQTHTLVFPCPTYLIEPWLRSRSLTSDTDTNQKQSPLYLLAGACFVFVCLFVCLFFGLCLITYLTPVDTATYTYTCVYVKQPTQSGT